MKRSRWVAVLLVVLFSLLWNQAGGVCVGQEANEVVVRRWLGPEFWANRLQDWERRGERIVCTANDRRRPVRTAYVYTAEITPGVAHTQISVRTGLAGGRPGGWSGFLIGIGEGRLDYRAAALVHGLAGGGGGIQCVFETDGRCRFRDHTSETEPYGFAALPAEQRQTRPAYERTPDEDIVLTLSIGPGRTPELVDLTLAARDHLTGEAISRAALRDVPERSVLGGVALLSHPGPEDGGSRFWFEDLAITGPKAARHPERTWGPVAGTLFSLNGPVLKLNAQFMPLGPTANDPSRGITAGRLDYREAGGQWQAGPVAPIEPPSQTALFRIADWDAGRRCEYRVVPLRADGSDAPVDQHYTGTIPADPVGKSELVIAGFTGCAFVGRSFAWDDPLAPFERPLGRFSPELMWLPSASALVALTGHAPDIMFFTGDQIYEHMPTPPARGPSPTDDYLYKWLHWVQSFREVTAHVPTIVQVDDHDVYQGNIWGWGGRDLPLGEPVRQGGYQRAPEWVNAVQRCQTAHNPDPYDPTPIEQNIGVYYNAFKYGGVSFAVLEDRKWKSPPALPNGQAELLGERQENFLREWAADWDDVMAKIAVTQTVFASTHTGPDGRIARDPDTNATPKWARDYAVRLLQHAGAFILSGDQHIALVVVQGLKEYDDGPVQFLVPAMGQWFQRWWEPAEPKSDRELEAPPYTGNFTDPFGNHFRMLTAVNPRISLRQSREAGAPGGGHKIVDPELTAAGYGIVRVDKAARRFIIECWQREADPEAEGGQFPGWPVIVPFPRSPAREGHPAPARPVHLGRRDEVVLHFTFDDMTGPMIRDLSGKQNDGRPVGTRPAEGALEFRNDAVVEVPVSPSLNPAGSAWSVEARVKPSSSDGAIVARGGDKEGYALGLKSGLPCLWVRTGGVIHAARADHQIVVDRWVRLTGVISEDGSLRLYVDGQLVAEAAGATLGSDPWEGMQIGADVGSSVGDYASPFRFRGLIDEIRVYNYAISPEAAAGRDA